MKTPLASLLVGFALFSASSVAAQTTADDAAIRQLEFEYNAAWNRHDAHGLAAQFVADTDFISAHGLWEKSRAAYEALEQELQSGRFKDSVRQTTEINIRFLTPELAIVVARYILDGDRDPGGGARSRREGLGTRLVQKRDGRWQTVHLQHTDLPTPPSR